jgi:hypothetical protein
LFLIDDEQVAGGQWGDFSGLESKEIRRLFIRKVCIIKIHTKVSVF